MSAWPKWAIREISLFTTAGYVPVWYYNIYDLASTEQSQPEQRQSLLRAAV